MGIVDHVTKLIRSSPETVITYHRLAGRGRMPTGWSRDYALIKRDGWTWHATQNAKGDTIIRAGYPHISSARDKTWAARDHVHLTRHGALRDDSLQTAARLGVKHATRMGGPVRTRLTPRALTRQAKGQVADVRRITNAIADTRKAPQSFGNNALMFSRQHETLAGLGTTLQQIDYTLNAMRAEASIARRGLPPGATTARLQWLASIDTAEKAVQAAITSQVKATRAAEVAARAASSAAEAATKAAAAQAELAAKVAARSAEAAAKEAVREAERAAKATAKTAEGLAKFATKAAERAIKLAAKAAEASAKAAAMTVEAAVRGTAYVAAAAVSSVFSR